MNFGKPDAPELAEWIVIRFPTTADKFRENSPDQMVPYQLT